MSRLVLVRHGRAAAGWDADADPGLDATGREQADAVAAALAPEGPLPVVVSPMRRTRETAAPVSMCAPASVASRASSFVTLPMPPRTIIQVPSLPGRRHML